MSPGKASALKNETQLDPAATVIAPAALPYTLYKIYYYYPNASSYSHV